jgi:hypothetical protein
VELSQNQEKYLFKTKLTISGFPASNLDTLSFMFFQNVFLLFTSSESFPLNSQSSILSLSETTFILVNNPLFTIVGLSSNHLSNSSTSSSINDFLNFSNIFFLGSAYHEKSFVGNFEK